MEALDLDVLRTLRDWRAAGRPALLATVVRTWGSSPRPVGSLMALRDDGAVVGSVSGGCVDDDLVARYDPRGSGARADALRAGPPQRLRYGAGADDAERFELPCGGTLELLLEHDPPVGPLTALVDALAAGRTVRRTVSLRDGATVLADADGPDDLVVGADTLTQTFGPAARMLLIGAGAIAGYLASMARFNGYAVTVCDPRAEHTAAFDAAGVTLTTAMPDDAVIAFRPDERSCVVALTHDPKLDDLALIDALASPAFYVGAIGSRRNHAARRQRLKAHFAVDDAALQRLHGPVGLAIGSHTPAEIAVSVMAHVIAAKNGVADVAPWPRPAAGAMGACGAQAPAGVAGDVDVAIGGGNRPV